MDKKEKSELTLKKKLLQNKKLDLLALINEVEEELKKLSRLEKPYVASVDAHSGHYESSFNTEEKARKKMEEYSRKQYIKNGLNYGVYLYKWNTDQTKKLIEFHPKGDKDYYPYRFKHDNIYYTEGDK